MDFDGFRPGLEGLEFGLAFGAVIFLIHFENNKNGETATIATIELVARVEGTQKWETVVVVIECVSRFLWSWVGEGNPGERVYKSKYVCIWQKKYYKSSLWIYVAFRSVPLRSHAWRGGE